VSTPPTTRGFSRSDPPKAPRFAELHPEALGREILQQPLLYSAEPVLRALVETAAAEHGARRTAMKNATDAGSDMLTILQRTFNRQGKLRLLKNWRDRRRRRGPKRLGVWYLVAWCQGVIPRHEPPNTGTHTRHQEPRILHGNEDQ